MAYPIGSFIGAFGAVFLASRLVLWLLKFIGDTMVRIVVAHLLVLAFATVVRAYTSAVDAPPDFVASFGLYIGPALVWTGLDYLMLLDRRAKASES